MGRRLSVQKTPCFCRRLFSGRPDGTSVNNRSTRPNDEIGHLLANGLQSGHPRKRIFSWTLRQCDKREEMCNKPACRWSSCCRVGFPFAWPAFKLGRLNTVSLLPLSSPKQVWNDWESKGRPAHRFWVRPARTSAWCGFTTQDRGACRIYPGMFPPSAEGPRNLRSWPKLCRTRLQNALPWPSISFSHRNKRSLGQTDSPTRSTNKLDHSWIRFSTCRKSLFWPLSPLKVKLWLGLRTNLETLAGESP